MFTDTLTDHNINTVLFNMASLSPTVRDSIENETYRTSADSDGSTDAYILEQSFKNLMIDLSTIGLTFDIDLSDYVEDYGKLSKFIQLAGLLLPNSLYTLIGTDNRIKKLIEDISGGTLGDNHTTIQTYLIELGGLEGTQPIRPELMDLIDELYLLVSQTNLFSDYLKNLIDLHNQERPSVLSDHHRHAEYRTRIRELIGLLSDAVNLLENTPSYDQLLIVQKYLILDLIAPDNFVDYAYLFLESKDTLPPELVDGYYTKWSQYKVSHPWCFEYYTLRNIQPSSIYCDLIICFAYALSNGDQARYSKLTAPLREKFSDEALDRMISSLF